MKTQLGDRPTAPQSPCQFFYWQSVILQNSQDYIFHAISLNIVLNKKKKKKKKMKKADGDRHCQGRTKFAISHVVTVRCTLAVKPNMPGFDKWFVSAVNKL